MGDGMSGRQEAKQTQRCLGRGRSEGGAGRCPTTKNLECQSEAGELCSGVKGRTRLSVRGCGRFLNRGWGQEQDKRPAWEF